MSTSPTNEEGNQIKYRDTYSDLMNLPGLSQTIETSRQVTIFREQKLSSRSEKSQGGQN